MMKIMSLISLMIVFVGDVKLVKTKIGDHITVNLPKHFLEATASDLARRYPSVRKPLGAYTDQDRLTDFSVNVSATQWGAGDIAIAKAFFKASVMELYDRTDFIKEEVQTINGRDYIVFEFNSVVNGDHDSLERQGAVRKYSYMQYLLINGKTIVFSFNTSAHLKAQWEEIVPAIMQSVTVKKTI